MNPPSADMVAPQVGGRVWEVYWQQALAELEKALAASGRDMEEPANDAERATVRMRDALIECLRERGGGQEALRWRQALAHANAAISLIAGVEFSASGMQRKKLEQARKSLKNL